MREAERGREREQGDTVYGARALSLKETAICLITFDPTVPDLELG